MRMKPYLSSDIVATGCKHNPVLLFDRPPFSFEIIAAIARMDQEEPEPPTSHSPPPGWHQIHGLPDPRHLTQTTSDLQVYGPPRIRIQIKEPIPAGATVTLKRNSRIKLRPNDGPVGFGYYKESDEDPSVINYHPVTGVAEHLGAGRGPRLSQRGQSRQHMPPPPPRVFNPGNLGGAQETDPWMLEKEAQEDARQMGTLSAPNPGSQPSATPPAMPLPSNPEHVETDPWVLNSPPEFNPKGLKGMSKETYAEMMKPVVPWEECTAWRKDPHYEARKRAEERKKDEEEDRKYWKEFCDNMKFPAFRRRHGY